MSDLLRAPAEAKYAEELDWLESVDRYQAVLLAAQPEDGADLRARLGTGRRPGARDIAEVVR
ncbi:hypothetical protein GCM10027456_13570 [Kineosporia babensis]